MPRSYLASAIFISLVLILAATWLRFSSDDDTENLVLVRGETVSISETESFISLIQEVPATTTPLNQTDKVGRQLLSDYLELVSKGHATPPNLDALAEKYTNNINGLQVSNKVEPDQINIVPDSIESFELYGKAVFEIRSKYANQLLKQYKAGSSDVIDDPEFINFLSLVSDFYNRAAVEITNLPVPASLADNHIKLINNYLSSGSATDGLSNIIGDPIAAIASMNTQKENGVEEDELLGYIHTTLLSHGVVLGRGDI